MTGSTTWLSIAGDDLDHIRKDIDARKAKWTDDDVVMRLLWDMVAALVGLGQEMQSEHQDAVKIWGHVRNPAPPAPVSDAWRCICGTLNEGHLRWTDEGWARRPEPEDDYPVDAACRGCQLSIEKQSHVTGLYAMTAL